MARYTTEQIISQFRDRHGDTFDYSLVSYEGTAVKVTIICRKHGAFDQLAGAHKRGQGCAKCMYDGKRSSLDEALQKFKSTHGDKYDYSLVKYKNVDTKVKIICSEHGVFLQTPYLHALGNGCPKCIGRHKTQDEILDLFRSTHGDKYDYSKVVFVRMNDKVEIVCPEHGSFMQAATNHIAGQGCIKCSGIYQPSKDEIVERFMAVHGARYNYDLVEYVNTSTKVKIVCGEHGVFEQVPYVHLGGGGCIKCSSCYQPTTSEAVEQFKAVHLDRYDYSKVVYKSAYVPVEIVCKTHGSFMQNPRTHKKGSGCPKCAVTIGHTKSSYLEYCAQFDGQAYLYLVKCWGSDESFYKVGIARQGALNRFDSRRKLPYEFEVVTEVKGDASLIWDLEDAIHKMLSEYSYSPKLPFSGQTECFSEIPTNVLKLIDGYSSSEQMMLIA